jgi:NADPH:quinone reductase-like Zn-dependent oxidoreductase
MKAIAERRPGRTNTFGRVELSEPLPGPGEVRVRVRAAAVNPADLKTTHGAAVGRMLHASMAPLVPGYDFAGVIERLGSDETDFRVDDSVFGHLAYSPTTRQGTCAERVVVNVEEIARKPDAISYETAAAAATVGLTALQGLRDKGDVRQGSRVLILGASGGVGSLAVGISKRLGAHVTAVCRTYGVDLVRGLGADVIVDRTKQGPLDHSELFDVIFDTTGKYSFTKCRKLLTQRGTFVSTLPTAGFALGKLEALFSSQRCELVQVRSRRVDLEQLGAWLADGLSVPIGDQYYVHDAQLALERMERGRLLGKVALTVPEGFDTKPPPASHQPPTNLEL